MSRWAVQMRSDEEIKHAIAQYLQERAERIERVRPEDWGGDRAVEDVRREAREEVNWFISLSD